MIIPYKYKRVATKWTKAAIFCYDRRCRCEGCPIDDMALESETCKMKIVVIELVRKFGVPEKGINA